MSLTQIIDGHWKELLNKEEGLNEKRKAICDGCRLQTKDKILGEICDKNKWLDLKTDEISNTKQDGLYNGCGCRLKAKRRIPEASCPLNKW